MTKVRPITRRVLILTAALLAVALMWGNSPARSRKQKAPLSQKILFGWEYENHAWGVAYEVRLVDRDGSIIKISNHKDENPDLPLLQLFKDSISGTIMDSLTASGPELTTGLPKDSVPSVLALIKSLGNTTLVMDSRVAADAGYETWFCYRYEEAARMYHRIVLRVDGCERGAVQDSSAEHLVKLISTYALKEHFEKKPD
jgi:hypothetical protein